MKNERHGISIGLERVGIEIFIGLKVVERLTHEDYQIFTPVFESAFAAIEDPNVKMLVGLGDLGGWEPRAAWDDFKIGLKHGQKFKKIALYGGLRWQGLVAKIAPWVACGNIESFATAKDAMNWLNLED